MLLFTKSNKILNLKIFLLTQHFAPKSAKFQINGKNDSPPVACAPPRCTIFLTMVKKAKRLFDGKKFNFSKQQGRKFQES